MRYIITSGPMEVKVDDVRSIKNSSTGKLGSIIADTLKMHGYTDIIYIHTKGAILPTSNVKCVLINDHTQLLEQIAKYITKSSVVVHAMAVSDFSLGGTVVVEQLADGIFTNLSSITNRDDVLSLINENMIQTNKLSSSSDQLISLKRNIKVIDEIKKLNNAAKLVGFKLLSDVTVDELITVANKLKVRSGADLIIANRIEDINASQHKAYIISDKQTVEVNTKLEIATTLINEMEKL